MLGDITEAECGGDMPDAPVAPGRRSYGGKFPWVGAAYKLEVNSGISPLQWLNGLTKRMLALGDIVLDTDGTLRRPNETVPMFPQGGIDLRWRWVQEDEADSGRVIFDFYKENKLMRWRWDELAPSKELRFPSTVPDWECIGHVGRFTFKYKLISAAFEAASFSASFVRPSVSGVLARCPRGAYTMDAPVYNAEVCRDFARTFFVCGLTSMESCRSEELARLFFACPGQQLNTSCSDNVISKQEPASSSPKVSQAALTFGGDVGSEGVDYVLQDFSTQLNEFILQTHASGGEIPSAVVERIIAWASTSTGLAVTDELCVLPVFLQPAHVIVSFGNPRQVRVVTYGYLAESSVEIEGDVPNRKRTSSVGRLLSPELASLSESDEWSVQYVVGQTKRAKIVDCIADEVGIFQATIESEHWSHFF
eukprot:TRINITY_DN57237_c0_g1_i1.p1 TRINITY_DN57237_c0_g1~~TRINITY_DN57237_c0_g1_i1.p1  ORF type:complete len:422 (-),score=30.19 TRINITY_DN57237_c0_g1_i1:130-1395(-)